MSGREFHAVIASGSLTSANQSHGIWLPIDLYLEDSLDGSNVTANSSVEALTGRSQSLYPNAYVLDSPRVV